MPSMQFMNCKAVVHRASSASSSACLQGWSQIACKLRMLSAPHVSPSSSEQRGGIQQWRREAERTCWKRQFATRLISQAAGTHRNTARDIKRNGAQATMLSADKSNSQLQKRNLRNTHSVNQRKQLRNAYAPLLICFTEGHHRLSHYESKSFDHQIPCFGDPNIGVHI